MAANFPTFPEAISSYSAMGVATETTFRQAATATDFTPFDSCAVEEDPAVFSPATMIGTTSTDVYPMQGEVKVDGGIKSPLYATNGTRMFLGAIGIDNIAGNGVTGAAALCPAGSPGNSTCSTLVAIGATTLPVLSGTGFAANQLAVLEPGTANAEVVAVNSVATNVLTISATKLAHDGSVTPFAVQTCGAIATPTPVAAGSSSITLMTGLGALFGTSPVIAQVDVNGTSTTAAVRKFTIAGDVLTISDLTPYNTFAFSHPASSWVIYCNAGPWSHTVPAGHLGSFTIEKNAGGVQSLIYPGCRFAKGSLAVPSGQTAANLSIDAMGAGVPFVQSVPTPASTTVESPYIFAEATFETMGAIHPECYNAKIDWDNGMKGTWTYSNDHHASFVTKTNLHVSGSFDAVFHNFDDVNDGFWTKAHTFAPGDLTLTMRHADGSSIKVVVPQIRIKKSPQTLTVGNIISQPITFMGFYGLSTGQANIVATVTSTQRYLPY